MSTNINSPQSGPPALHNTDKAFRLWNESWLTVDQDKLSIETHRENAIQNAIHPPKQQQKQENPQ
jgi:hypothetical protein